MLRRILHRIEQHQERRDAEVTVEAIEYILRQLEVMGKGDLGIQA